MKLQTQLAHPDFGTVHIKVYSDGDISLKQFRNERIYLTTEQLVELSKLLNEVVRELT